MRKAARENLTRLLSLFVLAVLVLAMCAGGSFSTRAYADTGKELNYDNTNVLDDLGSSTIDGKPFNVNDYPRNPFGTAQLITFVEYCYSQYEDAGKSGKSIEGRPAFKKMLSDIRSTRTATGIMRCTSMYITPRSRNFLSYLSVTRSRYPRTFSMRARKVKSGV